MNQSPFKCFITGMTHPLLKLKVLHLASYACRAGKTSFAAI